MSTEPQKNMQLTPVESSNIAAVGYDEQSQAMHVQFKDGTIYEWVQVTPLQHAELMDAKSKGSFLRCNFEAGRRSMGGECKPAPDIPALPKTTVLNTLPDDDCCGKLMRKIDLSALDTLTCPKCGCEWRPRVVGEIRHWEPFDVVEVFRR